MKRLCIYKIAQTQPIHYTPSIEETPKAVENLIFVVLQKQYFSLEHPKILVCDPEYFEGLVFKSWRKSRVNPVHYVDMNVTILKTLDSKFKVT